MKKKISEYIKMMENSNCIPMDDLIVNVPIKTKLELLAWIKDL